MHFASHITGFFGGVTMTLLIAGIFFIPDSPVYDSTNGLLMGITMMPLGVFTIISNIYYLAKTAD